MPTRLAHRVSLVLIGALAACGGQTGSTPSPSTGATSPTPAPAPSSFKPALTRLAMQGPASLGPGASAQYTVTATYGDGSMADVTSQAQWSSSNTSALSVTATGLATAHSLNGHAILTAGFGTRTANSSDVVVVPTGLFEVSVIATEQQVTVPIDSVLVTVMSGPSAGLSATTAWDGTAQLFGVSPDAQLSFTKAGYQTVVQSLHLTNNWSQVFTQLVPAASRPELAGQYQLTIDGSNCTETFPGTGAFLQASKTRTYTANISDNAGLNLIVSLSGANFVAGTCPLCGGNRGNGFTGQTQALGARFTLIGYVAPEDWNDGLYPDVVEAVGGAMLAVSGQAIVTPSSTGFAGTLDGMFGIYTDFNTNFQISVPSATCQSSAMPFTLVRAAGSH